MISSPEEAQALVTAAPIYPVRMAMRIMLQTGLRVSECLSLCAADLRMTQDPPIISLRPEVTGNKAKRGREVPIPDDLVGVWGTWRRFTLMGRCADIQEMANSR